MTDDLCIKKKMPPWLMGEFHHLVYILQAQSTAQFVEIVWTCHLRFWRLYNLRLHAYIIYISLCHEPIPISSARLPDLTILVYDSLTHLVVQVDVGWVMSLHGMHHIINHVNVFALQYLITEYKLCWCSPFPSTSCDTFRCNMDNSESKQALMEKYMHWNCWGCLHVCTCIQVP